MNPKCVCLKQVLPRLLLIPREILEDPSARILLPPSSLSPFVPEMLRLLEIDPSRALDVHYSNTLVGPPTISPSFISL